MPEKHKRKHLTSFQLIILGICGESLSEVMGDVRSVLPECTLIMPDNRGNSLW